MSNVANQSWIGTKISVDLNIVTTDPLPSDTWDRVKYVVGRIEALIAEVNNAASP